MLAAVLAVLALVFVASPSSGAGEPPPPPRVTSADGPLVDLRPRFKKNQVIRLVIEQTGSTSYAEAADRPGSPTSPRSSPPAPAPSQTSPLPPGVQPPAPQPSVPVRPRTTPRSPTREPARQPPAPTTAPASDDATRITQEIHLRLRITDIAPDGSATAELTQDRIKLSIIAPGDPDPLTIDTDDARSDSPLAPLVRPMVGQTMTLTIDPSGTITSATGNAGLVPHGLTGHAGAGPGAGATPTADLLGPLFTLKPGAPSARVGESWTTAARLPSPVIGDARIDTAYTLTGVRGGIAHIDFAGRINPHSESPGAQPVPIGIQNAEYSGVAQWDTAAGMLSRLTMTARSTAKTGPTTIIAEQRTTIRRVDR